MIIVDSTVWIDFVQRKQTPQTSWLKQNAGTEKIALTDLILAEVLQGTRNELEFRLTLERFLSFPIYSCAGVALAVASAHNYALLRRRGITIRKTIDCMIATFCIQQAFTLLHRDRDFDHFQREFGLSVVDLS